MFVRTINHNIMNSRGQICCIDICFTTRRDFLEIWPINANHILNSIFETLVFQNSLPTIQIIKTVRYLQLLIRLQKLRHSSFQGILLVDVCYELVTMRNASQCE